MALAKEFWVSEVIKKLVPDGSFLSSYKDYSSLVDNDKIHIPIQNTFPTVQVNTNLSNVATVVDKEKIDEGEKVINLDVYNTKETIVRDSDLFNLAYDKMSLLVDSHATAFGQEYAKRGAWQIAEGLTNGVSTTGATAAGGKQAKFNDFIDMASSFDKLNIPKENRHVIVTPQIKADLLKEDADRYHQVMTTGTLAGFHVMETTVVPYVNKTNGNTMAYSTTASTSNATEAAIFFYGEYVWRAQGTLKMFSRTNDSSILGNGFNFMGRFKTGRLMDIGVKTLYRG